MDDVRWKPVALIQSTSAKRKRSPILFFFFFCQSENREIITSKSENILCPATHTHTQKPESNCHMKLDLVKFSDLLKYWLSSDMIIIHTQFARDVLLRHITSNMIFKEYSLIQTLIFSTQKISLCPEE